MKISQLGEGRVWGYGGAANLPRVKAMDGSSSDPNCPYLYGRVYVTSACLRRWILCLSILEPRIRALGARRTSCLGL